MEHVPSYGVVVSSAFRLPEAAFTKEFRSTFVLGPASNSAMMIALREFAKVRQGLELDTFSMFNIRHLHMF